MYKYFCGYVFSFLLGIYLQVELLVIWQLYCCLIFYRTRSFCQDLSEEHIFEKAEKSLISRLLKKVLNEYHNQLNVTFDDY